MEGIMKKKILSIMFIFLMVLGIVISISNFSTSVYGNSGGPETVWGFWALNINCDLGWECIESTTVDCFSNNSGCR
jgi:hypothetical protein